MSKIGIFCLFVEEMQHLASDFCNILEKNRLPEVNVKKGETMMGIISSFQRHYVDPNKTDLNIRTHTFGTTAITDVMEQFRQYYLLVEKEAIKLQTEDEDENQAVSEEEQSTSVNRLSSRPQMDVYKTTSVSKQTTSTTAKGSETMSQGTKNRTTTQKTSTTSKGSATTKQKSKETEAKSKKAQKRKLLCDLTFSSSSDECTSSKKRKVSERIPDTQTMRRELTTLRLSPSQEESILNANRREGGHCPLKSGRRQKTH